jgi:hypothetical protein
MEFRYSELSDGARMGMQPETRCWSPRYPSDSRRKSQITETMLRPWGTFLAPLKILVRAGAASLWPARFVAAPSYRPFFDT